MAMPKKQRQSFLITFSIIIACILLTLGIYFAVQRSQLSKLQLKYPNCEPIISSTNAIANMRLMGDGKCDRSIDGSALVGLNKLECG